MINKMYTSKSCGMMHNGNEGLMQGSPAVPEGPKGRGSLQKGT